MEPKLIVEIKTIIESNFDDHQFTVEKLSREAAISKSQLYRKLTSTVGLSARQLITHIRIIKAKALLENSSHKISSIAYLTGFKDPDYFSKVFKKEVGMNPCDYRRSLQYEKSEL